MDGSLISNLYTAAEGAALNVAEPLSMLLNGVTLACSVVIVCFSVYYLRETIFK